jgi:hypothetical protein
MNTQCAEAGRRWYAHTILACCDIKVNNIYSEFDISIHSIYDDGGYPKGTW